MKLKRINKIIIIAAVVLMILVTVTFFSREFISNYFVRMNLDDIAVPGKGSRVLIIAPHNDDEILGAAELINKTIKNGGTVKVVMVTNGDGYKNAIKFDYFNLHPKPKDYVKFGYTRQEESLEALERYGINKKDVIFLGYPDGGIAALWSLYWDAGNPYISAFTQTNKSPYYNSFTKDAPFAGESLAADLFTIIRTYQPTHLVYPHPNDRHPDHWATNAFVKYVLAAEGYKPANEWLYLVHRGDWPTPLRKSTKMYLVPPAKLAGVGTKWLSLDMPAEDITIKASAINTYKTQIRTLKPLLTAFERKNELFGIYDNCKIVRTGKKDAEIQPATYNRVIADPLQDALTLEITKGSDISAVYSEISAEDNLHVFLATDGKIEKLTRYHLNMVLIENNKTSKLNLEIKGMKLSAKKVSEYSITDTSNISLEITDNYIHIKLPKEMFKSSRNIFINAMTSIEDHMLDKTAWRMLDM